MQDCEICGTKESIKFVFSAQCIVIDEVFSIGECQACKAQKVMNVPKNLNPYYINTHMRRLGANTHSFLKKFLLQRELKKVLSFVDTNPVFLDIGCGSGEFSKVIHEEGCSVIAIDSATDRPPAIENIKDIQYLMIDYQTGEIEGLKYMENGIVILRHVLEHVIDPAQFLKKMTSYGVKGFYILVPEHQCFLAKFLKQYYCYYDPPRHIWHFNQEALKQFFSRLGYQVKATGFYTIPDVVPTLYRWMHLIKAPRWTYDLFHPCGFLSAISVPFNFIFPRNIVWFYVQTT